MTVWETGRRADTVLALGLLAMVEILVATGSGPSTAPWPTGLLFGAVAVVPLIWRRRAPLVVWALTTVTVLTAIAVQAPPGLAAVPATLIALYTVASRHPRPVSLIVSLSTLVGLAGMAAGGRVTLALGAHRSSGGTDSGDGWFAFALSVVVIGGCWLIGDNVRVSRAYLAEQRATAARMETERVADLARVAEQERNRIARELHDVVVHHVSVIAVQAGAARMLAAPADDGRTWAEVEATARRALTELRQLLGVLRHGQERPDRTPPPGLDQLDRLVDEVHRAGLPVRCRVSGAPVPLSAAADLAAYRIVQEALTNVLKHQGRAATDVSVHYRAGELELTVVSASTTDSPPRSSAGRGHGLIGMRERVAVLGGRLDARPRPGGGFAVAAHIPLEGGATS